MSLDLTRVAAQVGEMLSGLKAGLSQRQEHLDNAVATAKARSDDIDLLKKKLRDSRTTWLVADLVDGLARSYQAPPLPDDFTVLATDGSHIDVDRHRAARCFLINIGSVVLRYGNNPDAVLGNSPALFAGDEDTVISPPGEKGREQPIEGTLLGIRRDLDECVFLGELAGQLPPGSDGLALIDGTLIHWGLEAYADFVKERLLGSGFIRCFDEFRKLNRERKIPLASYISLPRSQDVVNTLRVALCPQAKLNTDTHCPQCTTRQCDAVARVRDRDVFSVLLKKGERSELFITTSKIVRERYAGHTVYFFYLNNGEEIARVEVPQWVAADDDLLGLAHALIMDQCERGHGYPVALSEAHEQAVVTGADRENFWTLVEQEMEGEHMIPFSSAKSRSKLTRWL